ncbi:lipoate--protein ligase [Peptococcus simiae]|uniref:lipoate--protein ligase n=1 Tax=Peptococcus simiae TaxID=1643805 RepID=A0ABW9GVY4_9FIRM
MRYLDSPGLDPYRHFATEYHFATAVPLEEPVVMLWRTEPTLMIGKYQNTAQEINTRYAADHGLHIVRRPSGGGTIYTDPGAVQFGYIVPDHSEQISFDHFIRPVCAALAELGVQADFKGRNDLTVAGRKISGNAQYKIKGTTVHHGSILVDTDIEVMTAATTVDYEKLASKAISSVRDRVANLSEFLPAGTTITDVMACLRRHLCGGGPVIAISPADEAAIADLAANRFAAPDHTYGKNPASQIVKSRRLAGGRLRLALSLDKGLISDCQVGGDIFATEAADRLPDVLRGLPLEEGPLRRALVAAQMDRAFYRISIDDLIDLLLS